YKMEQESVERAVHLDPPVPLDFEWVDKSVRVTPRLDLEPDATYVLIVDRTATDIEGRLLDRRYNWSFKSVAAAAVVRSPAAPTPAPPQPPTAQPPPVPVAAPVVQAPTEFPPPPRVQVPPPATPTVRRPTPAPTRTARPPVPTRAAPGDAAPAGDGAAPAP